MLLYDKFIDWRSQIITEENKEQLVPYEGKFAVKHPDIFEVIKSAQSNLPTEWLYRPLNLEIEITNQCNLKCQHCGMHANLPHEIVSPSYDQLEHLAQDMARYKVSSIGFTGGEPFMTFDKMLYMISQCQQNSVDIMKITSNGFWGKDAAFKFRMLDSAGLLKNKNFQPLLMISIGEQTVPLETIAELIHTYTLHYKKEDLNLCISSLVNYGEPSKVPDLIATYESVFGEFPKGKIYLTETYYKNNKEMKDKANVNMQLPSDMIDTSIKCHTPTVGKHILPRMLVKANGTAYPCACFNVPTLFKSLNVYTDGLGAVLEDINQRDYIQVIRHEGIKGLCKDIDMVELDKKRFDDICTLCGYLCEHYKNK